jgi:N-ethylmaleimide reductase
MQPSYDGIDDHFVALARELADRGIQYIHVVDHSSKGAPPVLLSLKKAMRAAWPCTFRHAGGFDKASAQAALNDGAADLIAFGRPVLANPDFVARLQHDVALNTPDLSTVYTPGEKG